MSTVGTETENWTNTKAPYVVCSCSCYYQLVWSPSIIIAERILAMSVCVARRIVCATPRCVCAYDQADLGAGDRHQSDFSQYFSLLPSPQHRRRVSVCSPGRTGHYHIKMGTNKVPSHLMICIRRNINQIYCPISKTQRASKWESNFFRRRQRLTEFEHNVIAYGEWLFDFNFFFFFLFFFIGIYCGLHVVIMS